KDFEGKLMNGPNDVGQRPVGGMYMTDPYYKRPWWAKWNRPEGKQIQIEGVYFLSADHKTLIRVVEDLKQPNGITGTPDGKTLYVADIGAGKTYQYDIQADGKLANKKLICELGSDGMTLDNEGNLYLTGKGVTVFDKTGKQIEHIDVPGGWTGNLCFGGKDRSLLFIATSKAVWGMQMKTKGVHSK
ncbi:MAG: SMP-30/gluconolactonase/LRE family protein, partial [Tepidisphaerales bacterium]